MRTQSDCWRQDARAAPGGGESVSWGVRGEEGGWVRMSLHEEGMVEVGCCVW